MTARRLIVLLALLLAATACAGGGSATNGATAGSERLVISAAASLTDAFENLGARFGRQRPGSDLIFNFGGSQQLAQQIVSGAPAHVFASADFTQMEVAVAGGRIDEDAVQPFAANRLVIIYPLNSATPVTTLQDLARPGLRLVLPAEEVPAGRYVGQFLEKAAAGALGSQYRRRVLQNVVSYELNVRAVLTRVSLGEADAGIVYHSDVVGAQSANVGLAQIPDELNVFARYYLAPLTGAGDNALATDFIAFVLSTEGQSILQEYGFLSVNELQPD